jgi:hypothetical protein
MGVIRGSFFILKTGPERSLFFFKSSRKSSAFFTMVRNFMKSNGRPRKPMRWCLKRISPGDVNLIRNATNANGMDITPSKRLATPTSIIRFARNDEP